MTKPEIEAYFYEFIKYELEKVLTQLERDPNKSLWYKFWDKKSAFIYSYLLDDEFLFNLTLTSSLESKLGNALNNAIIRFILKEEIASSLGWMSFDELKQTLTEINVGIRVEEGKNLSFVLNIPGQEPSVDLSKISRADLDEYISELISLNDYTDESKDYKIDLILGCHREGVTYINLFELKAGGNLDSKKGPGDLTKLIKPYVLLQRQISMLGYHNKFSISFFFATLYDSRTGSVGSYLSREKILIGYEFWNALSQGMLSYEDIQNIYKKAASNVKFQMKIEELKKLTLQGASYMDCFDKTGKPIDKLRRKYKAQTGQSYKKADHFEFLRWFLNDQRRSLF